MPEQSKPEHTEEETQQAQKLVNDRGVPFGSRHRIGGKQYVKTPGGLQSCNYPWACSCHYCVYPDA